MVRVDGTPCSHYGAPVQRLPNMVDNYQDMVGNMGHYGSNNGRVSWVDETGRQWVGRADAETGKALLDAGYRDNGLYVPFSNGEHSLDPTVTFGLNVLRHGLDSEVNHHDLQINRSIRAEAAEKGITPMDDAAKAQFLKLDGMVIQHFDSTPQVVQGVMQRHMDFVNIGHYGHNNGVISFINDDGSIMVAAATAERIQILRDHGYTDNGLYVPMSNSERVVGFASARWVSGRDAQLANNYMKLDAFAIAQIEKAMGSPCHGEPRLRTKQGADAGLETRGDVLALAR